MSIEGEANSPIVPRESAFSFLKKHPILVIKVGLVALTLMYSGGLMAAGCHLDNPKMLGYVISAEVLGVGGLVPCLVILGYSERDSMMDALLVRAKIAQDRIKLSQQTIKKMRQAGFDVIGAERAVLRDLKSLQEVRHTDKIKEVSKKVKMMEREAQELEEMEKEFIRVMQEAEYTQSLQEASKEVKRINKEVKEADSQLKAIEGEAAFYEESLKKLAESRGGAVESHFFVYAAQTLVRLANAVQVAAEARQKKLNALMAQASLADEDQEEIEATKSSEVELQGMVEKVKEQLRFLANTASGISGVGSKERYLKQEIKLAQDKVNRMPTIKFTLLATSISFLKL